MKKRSRNRNLLAVVVIVAVAIGAFAVYGFAGRSPGTQPTSTANSQLAYLQITPLTPVLGSKNASVTIFEFGDFQCPSCDYWFKTQEKQIVHNLVDTGKAKLVWRDFVIYGTDSVSAAQAAYSANEQGRFWDYHDVLYSNQQAPYSGWASYNNLVIFAQNLGLNMTHFNQSFNSGKYVSLIKSNIADANSLGISGTPTFFVVGQHGQIVTIQGPQPYSVFQQAVDSVSG